MAGKSESWPRGRPVGSPPSPLAIVGAAFGILVIAVYLYLYAQMRAWQMLIIVGIVLVPVTLSVLSVVRQSRRQQSSTEMMWLLIPLFVCIASELVLSGRTHYHALGGVLIIFLIAAYSIQVHRWLAGVGMAGVYAAYLLAINELQLLPRLDLHQWFASHLSFIVVGAALSFIPIWGISRILRVGTIRERLLMASVLLVLLPAATISIVSVLGGLHYGRQQLINQLESVATLKEAEIDTWLATLESDLNGIFAGREMRKYVIETLSEDTDPTEQRVAHNKVQDRLIESLSLSRQYEELFLINVSGRTVLSTNPTREGQYHSVQPYFRGALQGFYVHPPVYSPAMGLVSVVAAAPIRDKHNEVLGVLASRVSPAVLNAIMLERTGLGETGETYLVDRHHTLLTGSRLPMQEFTDAYFVFTEGANSAVDTHEDGSGSYENYRGERVIGVYRWLPKIQVALLAEQHEAEAFAPMYRTLEINIAVAVGAIVLAAMASMIITGRITSRLGQLAETATRIASGDLERAADVGRQDEIGDLARAFNSMTAQLRDLINSLEQRVQERAGALQQRALQLETSARVSREITSILDINELLTRVVELIQEAFGYYHVQILLVDRESRNLVLQAATGAAGRALIREGYRLAIGPGSLNGEVAQNNEAIVCQDVSNEPRYQTTHQLPGTRSELVIPLRIGARVIGTLDVQSAELNSFGPEEIVVLQSLGDQISVAIENARLYRRTRELAVLEERNRLARELHDSVTQSLFSIDLHARAIATHLHRNSGEAERLICQLRQITQESLREIRSVIAALRPSSLDESGLVTALRTEVERESCDGRPQVTLDVFGSRRLPAEVELGLYRIAQEALHNAIKHAQARHIRVSLELGAGHAFLAVCDDGRGFDVDSLQTTRRSSFGLTGMQERATLLGGTFRVESEPGAGTRVEVQVPVLEEESQV